MKYLFVCSAGVHRSPEAARIAQEIFQRQGRPDNSFYCGISGLKKHEIESLVADYDIIIVMEKWMQNRIRSATHNRVIPKNINISDNYIGETDKKSLISQLERRLPRYI